MASGMVCVFFLSVISGLCLICFLSGEWSTPAVTGHPPPPLKRFSFTLVGSRAVLFAGLDDSVARNDVYCLDIDRKVIESVSDAWWELCGVGLWRRPHYCIAAQQSMHVLQCVAGSKVSHARLHVHVCTCQHMSLSSTPSHVHKITQWLAL